MWSQDINFRAYISATMPSKLLSWFVDVRSALRVLTEDQHRKYPTVGPDLELYLLSILVRNLQRVSNYYSESCYSRGFDRRHPCTGVSVEPWYFQHPGKVAEPESQTRHSFS